MSTFNAQVNDGIFDGYWKTSHPSFVDFDNTGTTMGIGDVDSDGWLYDCFIIFSGVSIPQGSTIASGYLTLTYQSATSNSDSHIAQCVNQDNVVPPTSSATANALPLTTQQVSWSNNSTGTGLPHQTSDITTIVQPVINRGGWTTGNHLGFVLTIPTPATHQAKLYTFENGSGIPTLTLFYGPAPSSTPLNSNFPMFIGQTCFASIYPSGDNGMAPSGFLKNSDNGSGNLYSYINTDPNSSLTDLTYLHTNGSGVANVPYIVYSETDIAGNNTLNKYDQALNQKTVLLNYPPNSGIVPVRLDVVNEFVYFGVQTYGGSAPQLRRYDLNTGVDSQISIPSLSISDMAFDYYNKKIYFTDSYGLYRCNSDGSLLESLYSAAAGTTINSLKEDLVNQRVYFNVTTVTPPATRLLFYDINSNLGGAVGLINGSTYTYTDVGTNRYYGKSGASSNNIDIYTHSPSTMALNLLTSSYVINAQYGDIKTDKFRNEIYYTVASVFSVIYIKRILILML
jgi:hypothetical protein